MKRIISLIAALTMLISTMSSTVAHADAPIKLGDYVQMGTYYGEPILWRCVSFEKISGYDEEGNPIIDSTDTVKEYQDGYLPLMLSDKILCLKAWDAKTGNSSVNSSHNRDMKRDDVGSNYWADSNIRSWLNSTEMVGDINWLCGNAPSIHYIWNGYFPYDQEAGFLSDFTNQEIKNILVVNQKSILSYPEYTNNEVTKTGTASYSDDLTIATIKSFSNYADAYSENITDKMFLIDTMQAYNLYQNKNLLGENYYLGGLTNKCLSEINDNRYTSNSGYNYWLRTPMASYISYGGYESVKFIDKIGSFKTNCTEPYKNEGVQPAFFLNVESISLTEGLGTEENPYKQPIYTLADKGEVNKAGARVGMYYNLNLSSVNNSVTMTVDDTDFTINDLGTIDVTTSLSFILLGKRAIGDIPDIQKVTGYGGIEYKEE